MVDNDLLKDKWVPVPNVDPMKRKPAEWAAIYYIKLIDRIDDIWSEYEWAYNLPDLSYFPLQDKDKKGVVLDSYEKSAEMEMRALELRRDLFMGADIGERFVLENEKKYIETDWVKRKLNLV